MRLIERTKSASGAFEALVHPRKVQNTLPSIETTKMTLSGEQISLLLDGYNVRRMVRYEN